MDRSGRVVLPRAVRDRFGISGASHEMEIVETPDGIVLRPVGHEVPATRAPSGWVVFHSETSDDARESVDPVAVVDAERDRRTRG